jgi:hypothetical protein
MADVTYISVVPRRSTQREERPAVVYVDAPAPQPLDAEPLASGRHRLERTPGHRPPATLWSWSQRRD